MGFRMPRKTMSFKLRKEMTVITPDDIMIHKQVREFDSI